MTANKATPEELLGRLNNYLGNGGFWNPDLMERDKMRNMIVDVRDFLAADLIESKRNAVIEECAKKCDEAGYSNQLQPIDNLAEKLAMAGATLQAKKLAIGIRALKDDSAVPVERQCERITK